MFPPFDKPFVGNNATGDFLTKWPGIAKNMWSFKDSAEIEPTDE